MAKTIALDAMGGDLGPNVVISAARNAVGKHPDLHLILVGQEDVLLKGMADFDASERHRITVRHASQQVAMDEQPSLALRNKKDSSMRVAINLVKEKQADACVSSGNTGALMATAKFVLKTVPGIDRPAICTSLPAMDGHTHVLDLGANVDCKAEHLLQFAVMGSVLVSAVDGISNPRVGLLNVGSEDMKGNDQVKRATSLLAASHLNYIGFVEGNDLFRKDIDVVVCDGFVGNIALKSIEGFARLLKHFMTIEFRKNLMTKLCGLAAMPVLEAFGRRLDPRRYNGASFLGLRGIVVKSHGSADELAFGNAIDTALREVEKGVPAAIEQYFIEKGRKVEGNDRGT